MIFIQNFKVKIYYDSFNRFTSRIVKKWDKQGTTYNRGNISILVFAWKTKVYWSNRNGERVAKVNFEDTKQIKLF